MVPAVNDRGDNRHDWTDAAVSLGDDRVAEHPDPRAGTLFGMAAGGYPDSLCIRIFRASRVAVQEAGDVKRHLDCESWVP